MSILEKIQKVMGIFLLFFLVIFLKVWHLSVIQREEKILESIKPQQKTVLMRANRGLIFDRFGIPMAVNRICYNASIYYSQIAQIPSRAWKKDTEGKEMRTFPRKEYIETLSSLLAGVLELDERRIEDLIHSKASLFPHAPFILKSDLTEKEYYKLKMLEKDFPGIAAEIGQTRFYPQGKTACHILGTMGAIGPKQYAEIAEKTSELQAALDFGDLSVAERLLELKEKAYTINDLVGKTGIELRYEEELRGYLGKKIFDVDQKGHFIKKTFEKKALDGKQLVLTISSQLQEFAESLLCQNEKVRDGKSRGYDPRDGIRKVQKQPWIKGGAILALDPKNGEVLALASHPRFDPNDFIYQATSIFSAGKEKRINRWLENESFIGDLWDGIEVLSREHPSFEAEEIASLSWELYLEEVLHPSSPLYAYLKSISVKQAIELQEDLETKLYYEKEGKALPTLTQRRLNALNFSEKELFFAADLCRIAVYAPAFTDELISKISDMTVGTYRTLCQKFLKQERALKEKERLSFQKHEFQKWKAAHQKEFLEERRKEEKEKKIFPRPYIDYLDAIEKKLFDLYWVEKKYEALKEEGFSEELMRTFRSFKELTRPLLGQYATIKGGREKDLAKAFYPAEKFGFSKSYAFESEVPPGSVFKLVTAYVGLRQKKDLTIIDELSPKGVAFTLSRKLYPRYYKGGRLPKSAARNMGVIDLKTAIERSSNPYFSILAGDCFEDPEDLIHAAKLFGYGEKTGIDLPREKTGSLPSDLKTNRTGLYSAAIGQHTLLTTPLQTATMLAAIVNGGDLLKPKIVQKTIGASPDRDPLGSFIGENYFAKNELGKLGIFFPLFTSMQPPFEMEKEKKSPLEIRKKIKLEEPIRSTLIKGMDRVVNGEKGSARAPAIKALLQNPSLMQEYKSLAKDMAGKTGTAEILYRPFKNPGAKAEIYKYTWFAVSSFLDEEKQNPELVVVVFLRFSDSGKEAAPLAAQMVQKWREIKKQHSLQDAEKLEAEPLSSNSFQNMQPSF